MRVDNIVQRKLVAGVDEAGRGPLAGPVVAAAVILDENNWIEGLGDSKTISEKKRRRLALEIQQKSIAWAIGQVEHEEIDELNILNASMLAMQRAVQGLGVNPHHVQVDGNRCPELNCSVESIVKGDALVAAIGAASILAKVTRDTLMIEMDDRYPGYGFAKHKGYPTKQHSEALARLGVCEIHRRSYAPVRKFLL
jgi:ribonuclease HII